MNRGGWARNDRNLLAGLTPTYTNWTTNPGADLTNETANTILSTPGVGAIGANRVTFDIGRIIRGIFYLNTERSAAEGEISLNNQNWYNLIPSANTQKGAGIGQFRYVRFTETAAGVINVNYLKMRVYEV